MTKSLFAKLGLVEDNDPMNSPAPVVAPAPAPTAAVQASPAYPQQTWAPPAQSWSPTPVQSTSFDPDMVSKIKSSVFGASPIINQFMQNLDLVRPQFPNDESACMRAALAFTRVDKNTLIGELNRTVAAALLHTKSGLENEHKKARDSAVGGLESQLSSVNSDITDTGNQINQLQQALASKQANATDLQGKIRDAEASLQQQDAVVKGSLTQVEQYVAQLGQTFAKL